MREILFRGKRVDNGEWVIGDGIHYPKSQNWKGTCWIDGMHERANDWVQVIPETVGQYTGLTDKNGTKIFEGDILKYFDDEIQVVEFWKDTSQIMLHSYGEIERKVGRKTIKENFDGWNWLDDFPLDEMPIIGNIHDNPELLGVE